MQRHNDNWLHCFSIQPDIHWMGLGGPMVEFIQSAIKRCHVYFPMWVFSEISYYGRGASAFGDGTGELQPKQVDILVIFINAAHESAKPVNTLFIEIAATDRFAG